MRHPDQNHRANDRHTNNGLIPAPSRPTRARLVHLLFLLGITQALPACGVPTGDSDTDVTSGPDPFLFETASNHSFDLRVTVDGVPAAYASIQLVGALPPIAPDETIEELITGAVYHKGTTDVDGRLQTLVSLPATVDTVDLVVQVAGARGPYSVPSHRLLWGPFAPSARLTLGLAELAPVTVNLEME